MAISPLAGKPAPKEMLVDVGRLEREYYDRKPDVGDPNQPVHFGTSGHRGSPLRGTFTEAHILAITQAICFYRRAQGIDGPLYMGKDTHALSGPAQRTAIEVLAGNGVETIIQRDDGVTPTPVISRAILVYNRGRRDNPADGIVITPSHNPPEDGGFKYNPPQRGPGQLRRDGLGAAPRHPRAHLAQTRRSRGTLASPAESSACTRSGPRRRSRNSRGSLASSRTGWWQPRKNSWGGRKRPRRHNLQPRATREGNADWGCAIVSRLGPLIGGALAGGLMRVIGF